MSRYQKGKTNLDFSETRDSEWQWHQLGYMQVCNSFQTDNHASTPPLSFYVFLQAGCTSCSPCNSVKVLKAQYFLDTYIEIILLVFVASPNFTKLLVTLAVICVFIDDVSITLLIICGNRWRFCAAVGAYFAVS